jgi:hypothetical protein
MPYSQSLAARVRDALAQRRGITERRLFGGLSFLLYGNLLVAVWGYSLIVRLGREQAELALSRPYVREFDATGRPMKGWVVVDPEAIDSDHQLREWVEMAWDFVASLPPK